MKPIIDQRIDLIYFVKFGDQSGLNHINQSLNHLQKLIGRIPNAYSKGDFANIVSDMLFKANTSSNSNHSLISNEESIISNLIIFDRSEDYVSVLLSQLNYIGVIDEMFSIKSGKIIKIFIVLEN